MTRSCLQELHFLAFLYKCLNIGNEDTHMESNIKKMLALQRQGAVYLASWLKVQGISRDLQKGYRRGGWLESVGPGAFKRPGEEVRWQGGLYALQSQAKLPIHPGAMTALAMQGLAHYLRLGREIVWLFSPRKTTLPAWFKKLDWEVQIQHIQTSILPPTLGLDDHDEKSFTIQISSPERAMLECLHLAPNNLDLMECSQVMEALLNLRPKLVQELLQACTSIKAKRLFVYLAEKAGHPWLPLVDMSKVDFGRGDRSLAKGGVYVAKYHLVLPESLVAQ